MNEDEKVVETPVVEESIEVLSPIPEEMKEEAEASNVPPAEFEESEIGEDDDTTV